MAAVNPPQSTAALVCGLGLRACASLASLQALWQRAQAEISGAASASHTVAVLAGKEHHPALLAWLETWNQQPLLWALPACSLQGQAVITQSPRLLARYGTGSVAEALALAACGQYAHDAQGVRLLLPRIIAVDGSATLAIACSIPSKSQGVFV